MRKKSSVFVYYPDATTITYEYCTDVTYIGSAVRFLCAGKWHVISSNWEVTEEEGYGTVLL
jgi:hypothetical protein